MKTNQGECTNNSEPIWIDTDSLSRIAMFLEGMRVGRGGNIRPLGTIELENLWFAIRLLNGDERYKVRERKSHTN